MPGMIHWRRGLAVRWTGLIGGLVVVVGWFLAFCVQFTLLFKDVELSLLVEQLESIIKG